MQAGVGVAIQVRQRHPAGRDAVLDEQVEQLVGHGPQLAVHRDRRAGAHRRPGAGGETSALRERQRLVGGGELDHAGSGGTGLRSRALPVAFVHADGEVGGEQLGQGVLRLGEDPVAGGVVHVAVEAGGGDDVQPGPRGEQPQPSRVAAAADRREVRDGMRTGGAYRRRLGHHGLQLGKGLAGQRRRAEEQVLVRVGGPERFRRDRPQHGLDGVPQAILHGASRNGARDAASYRRRGGARRPRDRRSR